MESNNSSIGLNPFATLLTSRLKTTRSSEFVPRAFGADNDEVVVGGYGGRADETVENSAKSRNSKHSTKLPKSSQRVI